MKEEYSMSYDDALQIILGSVEQKKAESVSIHNALGRISYEDIISDIHIPSFDNSAMDGYAVRHEDTQGATHNTPICLKVTGEIQAGENSEIELSKTKSALRIMTGAPVPRGADSVIPVEFTHEDEAAATVMIYKEMAVHENIRFAGEDIKTGQTIIQKGDRLRSAEIGLLAAVNKKDIMTYTIPEVAIISTGNEIVDVGEIIGRGQVRNTNAYTIMAEVRKYRGNPRYIGIAKDELAITKQKFNEAMNADIIISTGGVSKGKYDLVKDVLSELGVEILIEKINMKPGRPIVFGKKNEKLFFGLPGNPVSTLVSFIEFVRPALLKMSGAGKIKKPEIQAILEDTIKKKDGRKEFIRGYYYLKNNIIHVRSTGPQGSGILCSMRDANCLIVIPENSQGCKAGDHVLIQLIEHEEID